MNETQDELRSNETGLFNAGERPDIPEDLEVVLWRAPGMDRGFDREPLPYVTLSAAAHILMLLIILAMPENVGALDLDGFRADDRFVQLSMAPEREDLEPPEWLGAGAEKPEATARHGGAEGKAGDPNEQALDKKMAIKGDAPEDLEVKKARDLEVASTAGIASIAQVSSMYANSAQSIGSDALHAIGSLEGSDLGPSKGMGGLGVKCDSARDECFGGGGTKTGSIGLKRVATQGKSTGRDYDRGDPNLGEHDGKVPGRVVNHEPPRLMGGLDREIVQRVVRSHRREIKFCYEEELQKDRRLEGELVVKFTILPTGRVVSSVSESTTLKSPAAEACMHSKIKRWIFPEPDGGGTVVVRYPFRFSPGS